MKTTLGRKKRENGLTLTGLLMEGLELRRLARGPPPFEAQGKGRRSLVVLVCVDKAQQVEE
jgi:hypothetical protein